MPELNGVLETALYVDDLPRARQFYQEVLGLSPMFSDNRLTAFDVGRSVLLLFKRGASLSPMTLPGGTIPPHDGSGPMHFAFAISKEDLKPWEDRLRSRGLEIEARTKWPRGGESIYFRDPDNNVVELATPGLWPNY